MLIKNNAGPATYDGFICNFNMFGIETNLNTFNVYLWVMSISATANKQLNIYGCDTAKTSCLTDADFTVALTTANTYNQYDLKVELITITNSASANTAVISVNSGAVYYIFNI